MVRTIKTKIKETDIPLLIIAKADSYSQKLLGAKNLIDRKLFLKGVRYAVKQYTNYLKKSQNETLD